LNDARLVPNGQAATGVTHPDIPWRQPGGPSGCPAGRGHSL